MSQDYFKIVLEQLPSEEIKTLLNPDPLLCIAIKTQDQGYVYGNQNFLKLMGFSHLKELTHKFDHDLCSNKTLLKVYQEHDETVYSEDKPLIVQGDISPDRQDKLVKSMEGIIHPLHINGTHPDAVMLIHKPSNEMINLTLGILLNSSTDKLGAVLTKNSYPVMLKGLTISLARMELMCFAELLKGKSATKIAEALGIKSLTVESYLTNLRDKCGVGTKSDLVNFFIDNHLLETIVV